MSFDEQNGLDNTEFAPRLRDNVTAGADPHAKTPKDGWPYAPGVWQRVSSKYALVDLVQNLLIAAVMLVIIGVNYLFGWQLPLPVVLILVAVAVTTVVSAALSFRRTKSIGYILREDDFVYRVGLLFHRTVAVPYGRLQLVDVRQGPIMRVFGLASLKFVTAAAGSNVELPGLEISVADRLRNELITIAETRRSGL